MGRGGRDVSSVMASLELRFALGGVSLANCTAMASSDNPRSPIPLLSVAIAAEAVVSTATDAASCLSSKSFSLIVVSVATGISNGSPKELATDPASQG